MVEIVCLGVGRVRGDVYIEKNAFIDLLCYATLCDPINHSPLLCPCGFSRQEYWSGLPCSPPGDLPKKGTEPIIKQINNVFNPFNSLLLVI